MSKYKIILWIFILAYIIYFSYFTILRFKTLYASYYDLGIMNQTVYNTFQAIKKQDWNRFLELTDVDSSSQIKRMAIHNDLLLALIAPFYFIYSGPETLLVIQSIILGLGALAVFKIAQIVFNNSKYKDVLSLVFALAYLLYPPLERANIFDFHAVTLATTFLLFMFYFWLKKRYKLSFLFVVLSLLSKEEVGLTIAFFGFYTIFFQNKRFVRLNLFQHLDKFKKKSILFSILIIVVSLSWFFLSILVITPFFRGGHHFALDYYGDFGDSPSSIIFGILKNPYSISKYLFRYDTLTYLLQLLGPTAFLSLLSPIQFLIALPELGINLLSSNFNMRNLIYQYSAVITPFVFISAIYGARKLINVKFKMLNVKSTSQMSNLVVIMMFIATLVFSYLKGPLPFSHEAEIHPFLYPQVEAKDVIFWAKTLQDENLKISTTGQEAPFFTSRRYFYNFSGLYNLANYVILRLNEVNDYPEKNQLIPVYNKLKEDKNYQLIFKRNKLEVYKKVISN